ncbi:hypothetical protein CH35J_006220 [Colletotrichum higginsianum]|uniref:Uncharacterized protein n=1 Tax=Colletotrichum higginsianum TaxID=80884 RepID=A0A4T0W288_9PEZI|nr:hypothetical protein CH35J_006220 [Colletotrichum higginsianum]
MTRPVLFTTVLGLLLLLQLLGFATAASKPKPKFCTKDKAVAKCVSAVNKHVKTTIVSKYCSSVMQCPPDSTTTLKGTVTTTRTKTKNGGAVPWTEITVVSTTTWTFDYTETTYTPVATSTERPTWTVEKFEVTTLALNKREPKKHHDPNPKIKMFPLRVRASCDEEVQEKACACLHTCPPVVTKDERKTVKTVEKEFYYTYSTVYEPYTETEYAPIYHTDVISYTETEVAEILATNTRTATCTPSVSNPSFYLSATMTSYPSNLPTPLPYYQKYMRIVPNFEFFREAGALFWPRYVAPKAEAGSFSLDSQGRLMSETSYGVHYLSTDPYGDFQLVEFLPEPFVDLRKWYYIYCNMIPPSGQFAGGYKELNCSGAFFQVDTFQYCPLYDEYFDTGSVIGSEMSDTSPDCFPMTFLVVPMCT